MLADRCMQSLSGRSVFLLQRRGGRIAIFYWAVGRGIEWDARGGCCTHRAWLAGGVHCVVAVVQAGITVIVSAKARVCLCAVLEHACFAMTHGVDVIPVDSHCR